MIQLATEEKLEHPGFVTVVAFVILISIYRESVIGIVHGILDRLMSWLESLEEQALPLLRSCRGGFWWKLGCSPTW